MPAEPPIAVLLIHGTFAYAESERGAAWWQLGSDFQTALGKLLGPSFEVQPSEMVFRWAGTNSEAERRGAARRLSRQIVTLEQSGRPYMFVGHSHGGAVLFDALTIATEEMPGLPGLRRWITVGTPFLRFASENNLGWLTLALVAALGSAAAALQVQWHVAVTQWLEILTHPRPVELVLTALVDVALAILLFASATRLWRCVRGQLREAKLNRDRTRAFKTLRSRYVGLFSSDDEAINGLGSTLAFGGPMMVRLKSRWGKLYNRLVAPVGDQFIWAQLSKRSQGNDMSGVRLARVLTAPVDDAERFELSPEANGSLMTRANTRTASVASSLRTALHSIAFGAQPIEYLRRIAQNAGAVDSLIHTSYFADTQVRELLREALTGRSSAVNGATIATTFNAPRFALLAAVWGAGIGVVAISLALQLVALLRPLQTEALVVSALARTAFLAATFGEPDRPYELVRALAAHRHPDLARQLVSQVQLSDDTKLARATLAIGLRSAGSETEGRLVITELLNTVVTTPAVPRGTYGPDPPQPSMGDLAIGRALGFYGMSDEAVRFINTFDGDPVHKALAQEVLRGIVIAGHATLLSHWAEPSGAASTRPDLLAGAFELTCDDFLTEGSPVDPEIEATRLTRDLRCGHAVDVPATLNSILGAPARVKAACEVARIWAVQGRKDAAVLLLTEERRKFPGFRRHPLEGRAIHHVRYAAAFLDVGSPTESRAVMLAIEAMRGEKYVDGDLEPVADDKSERERALLWARLGDADKALRWWDMLPEGPGELDVKFQTLTAISAELSREGRPLPSRERLGQDRTEDAERWRRMASVYEAIGAYDGEVDSKNRLQRARLLDGIAALARLIDDPHQGSMAHACIAERFLELGMPRSALSIAALCQPVEQVAILTKAVELYL